MRISRSKKLTTLSDLNTCLAEWFLCNSISISDSSHGYISSLIVEPDANQLTQLATGSGNPLAEMYQINSSAGLAINYHKLLEQSNSISNLEFEWKKQIPLKRGIPANLDVRYEKENTIVFVESKFLEPYYSNPKMNSESYKDRQKYMFDENVELWIEQIRNEAAFQYYDFPQMCRHLMAIYVHYNNRGLCQDRKIVLQSIGWKMTDEFVEFCRQLGFEITSMQRRCTIIENEKNKAKQLAHPTNPVD